MNGAKIVVEFHFGDLVKATFEGYGDIVRIIFEGTFGQNTWFLKLIQFFFFRM